MTNRSPVQTRSKIAAAACAAGTSSQRPCHGQIASSGAYATYVSGP